MRKNAVLVHSSLSSFGGAGAETVIHALLTAGASRHLTLMMPSHSDSRSDGEDPLLPVLFDRRKTPCSLMGKIPEHFRTMQGVRRSAHPLLSFCAKGPLAGKLTRGHRAATALGKGSPLEKLNRGDGLVLMLGTDWAACTALHLAEYEAARGKEKQGLPVDRVTCAAGVLSCGRVFLKTWTDIAFHVDRFAETGAAFERECPGKLLQGDLPRMDGDRPRGYRLMRIRDIVDFSIDRCGHLE